MNTRDNEILTMDNIIDIGARIAKCAVRGYARISGNNRIHKLYASLCRDEMYKDNIRYVISDGYDLVQESICFLLEHIGERLSDKTCKGWRGDEITVKTACYRHLGNYIQRNARSEMQRVSLESMEYNEPYTYDILLENNSIEQEREVEETIGRMNLSQEEKETLLCYMAGMGYVEIAKHCAVQLTTIWYRRQRIQRKYNALFGV